MRVDFGRKRLFPKEIAETSLRPDMVLWSTASKTVLLVGLTVPWEEGLEAVHEKKQEKYTDLATECRSRLEGHICPVEVGSRGFVGASTSRLLRDLGCTGASGHQRAVEGVGGGGRKKQFLVVAVEEG